MPWVAELRMLSSTLMPVFELLREVPSPPRFEVSTWWPLLVRVSIWRAWREGYLNDISVA